MNFHNYYFSWAILMNLFKAVKKSLIEMKVNSPNRSVCGIHFIILIFPARLDGLSPS